MLEKGKTWILAVKRQSYINQISRNPSSAIELKNVESSKGVKIDD